MPRRSTPAATDAVASIAHRAKRKNLPPSGIESHGELREEAAVAYWHNPHLPPRLVSSAYPAAADRLRDVLAEARQRALTEDEVRTLDEAIKQHEPWLDWSGKRERPWFEVDPVALHMHERVSTQAILRVLARQDVNRSLFADPQLDYAKAVQFYSHDVEWSNRMILGDSLQVMASLARREDLAGKVQMIYVDPPYGIKFASNFQPELGRRTVTDKEKDFTREPETIRAYRDTWTLGIHSYLSYLRDRFTMMRDLLAESGSIFVQISDENVHLVRCLLDEVFGPECFVSQIAFQTTSGFETKTLATLGDYLLWYARDKERLKVRKLFEEQPAVPGEGNARWVLLPDGTYRGVAAAERRGEMPLPDGARLYKPDNLQSQGPSSEPQPLEFQGKVYLPGANSHWKANYPEGPDRLAAANRIHVARNSIQYRRFATDFPYKERGNIWTDTLTGSFTERKVYVVQTNPKVVERCILMTSDPGDLVLDPTCGSGTTALCAEQWGRRWITIDTSRVALTLAKHRLMTAKFDYYKLRDLDARDVERNPGGPWISETDEAGRPTGGPTTFRCRKVPHVTLRSIARNASLDSIVQKHEPVLSGALERLNHALADVGDDVKARLVGKLIEKHRSEGAKAVTEADVRRWLLPGASTRNIKPAPARKPFKALTAAQAEKYRNAAPAKVWREWEVPADADSDWPKALADALEPYRRASRSKMSEVNDCIEADAESEELVDKPEIVRGTVRVAGPFTMEGVIALEEGPDTPIGGAPEELGAFDPEQAGIAAANAEAHLDKVLRLLKATGVDFAGSTRMKFTEMEPATGPTPIHAEGYWENGTRTARRVGISVGPEAGSVSSLQVEEAVRSANRVGYDDLVFAGFGFDPAAQEAIEDSSHPKMRLHMALINPDVAMDDLLRTQPGSQIFTVFSAPRVEGPIPRGDGKFTVAVEGMDVYDPVKSTLHPTDKSRIAAWFLDTDYDGRTFCICQAFFPGKKKWSKLAKALGDAGMVERGAFQALSGLESLPFERPARQPPHRDWRVAVKVIDPRGNEGLRVVTVSDWLGH